MELVGHGLSGRIADALAAACHPTPALASSVPAMATVWLATAEGWAAAPGAVGGIVAADERVDVDALVVTLFEQEAHRLVRLVRLFVDDRNAAEDLVQEGFIRFARNAHRLQDQAKAAAYLRSIVLNLARDENRRGLVSLRHQVPADDQAVDRGGRGRAPRRPAAGHRRRCGTCRRASATASSCATSTRPGSPRSPRRSASRRTR